MTVIDRLGPALVRPFLYAVVAWSIPAIAVEALSRADNCGSLWFWWREPPPGTDGAVCGYVGAGLLMAWLLACVTTEGIAGVLSARIGVETGIPAAALVAGLLGAAGTTFFLLSIASLSGFSESMGTFAMQAMLPSVVGFAAGYGLEYWWHKR